MKKSFLLDTSVLLRSPSALLRFDDNDVNICYTTLKDLDGRKERGGDEGFAARNIIRAIFELQEKNNDIKNIKLPTGGTFNIIEDHSNWDVTSEDIVISTALQCGMILVTSDTAMYLRAKSLKCDAEMYRNETAKESSIKYTGRRDVMLSPDIINSLYSQRKISLPKELSDMKENEYAVIKDAFGSSQSAIGRRRGEMLISVDRNLHPYNVTARNVAQTCALDALLAPADEIPLVFLIGPAGTAKTFLSMAAGLQQVQNKMYTRMLLLRPNIKFDDDIGFLKGDEKDKIMPLLRPCLDNLEAVIAPTIESTDYAREKVNCLFEKGIIEGEALAYIRGRSIANNYVVVDEAQNSTPNQMFGIITRAGSGAKFVITGDPEQIDNPIVDKKNNGLVFAAERMMSSQLCAQIGFKNSECERSALATEAAKLLSM